MAAPLPAMRGMTVFGATIFGIESAPSLGNDAKLLDDPPCGLLASLLFRFMPSFDEFTRTLFPIGSDTPLPISCRSNIPTDPAPAASAIATMPVRCFLGVVGAGLLPLGLRRRPGAVAGAH